jgi:mannan endo-1,4-beta-mannosidase
MRRRTLLGVFTAAATAITVLALTSAASVASAPSAKPAEPRQAGLSRAATHARSETKHQLLHPHRKYDGLYVSQAPGLMGPIRKLAKATGKPANLSLFYEDWGPTAAAGRPNLSVSGARNACRAGMLPMLTWESWNTQNVGAHGPAFTQPAFSPRRIINGRYDRYIRATAREISHLGCPIALRLDQEVNSYWYPWGINAAGMHNSAHLYVRMWRHVWRIFHAVHARNVIWVWSPNVQSRTHHGLPSLAKSYPGARFVDLVGIDGYFFRHPRQGFAGLFGPTIRQLRHVAPHKPWIIAEAGVGSGRSKPRQIRELFAAVARSPRFIGINYFDTNKPYLRSDWSVTETAASLAAYKAAVRNPAFASGNSDIPLGKMR